MEAPIHAASIPDPCVVDHPARGRTLRRTHPARSILGCWASVLTIVASPGEIPPDPWLLHDPDEGSLMDHPDWGGFQWLERAVIRADAQGTHLDTLTDPAEMAGWLRIAPHPISPSIPVQIVFSLAILDERHLSPDRAGFSLLVLRDDLSGIELGFWTQRIWAQSDAPLFTQAEGTPHDTLPLQSYRLVLEADHYQLHAVDPSTPLLQGPLRNYSSFEGPLNPYRTPNLIFVGDNTRSASASVIVGKMTLQRSDGKPPSSPPLLDWLKTPTTLVLKWDPSQDWILESTPSLESTPTDWKPVDTDPSTPGRHVLPLKDGVHARWFRLGSSGSAWKTRIDPQTIPGSGVP
jgi:hypothetical protein